MEGHQVGHQPVREQERYLPVRRGATQLTEINDYDDRSQNCRHI
jgi:hypothetical protein